MPQQQRKPDDQPASAPTTAAPAGVPLAPEAAPPTSPPEPATPLDKRADRLAVKADAAQDKADDLADDAQKAAEAAEDEDLSGTVRRCPHCRTHMQQHGDADPNKAGCWHCSTNVGGCGCCFAPGIRHVRPGTATCALADRA